LLTITHFGNLIEVQLCRSLGGRLTLNKNVGTGTLVDALHLLQPYLPPNFIPNALPMSTLAGITALDKKLSPALNFSVTFQSRAKRVASA
jgi:hypothetical protein